MPRRSLCNPHASILGAFGSTTFGSVGLVWFGWVGLGFVWFGLGSVRFGCIGLAWAGFGACAQPSDQGPCDRLTDLKKNESSSRRWLFTQSSKLTQTTARLPRVMQDISCPGHRSVRFSVLARRRERCSSSSGPVPRQEVTRTGILNPFQDCGPVLGTDHSNSKSFVPKTGLRSYRGLRVSVVGTNCLEIYCSKM